MARSARLLFLGLLLIPGCAQPSQPKPTLTVSAASDLTNAFREIGNRYEQEHGVHVDFNFGSSGKLARQIEQGAKVDLFASANVAFVDELERQGLIVPETRALYARGRLVSWQRADAPAQVNELADLAKSEIRRVAIANPEHAPYGAAAKQALQSLGIWDAVQPKLVIGENIRQAMQFAETGNVDVGLVALPLCRPGGGRWRLVPEELHQPLDQALAVIASTPQLDEAKRFAEYINGPVGRKILRSHGLVLPGESLPPELVGNAAGVPAASTSAAP